MRILVNRETVSIKFRAFLRALVIFSLGAWSVLFYLYIVLGRKDIEVQELYYIMWVTTLILSGALNFLTPQSDRAAREISPAWSGAGVVVATGIAGAIYLGWGARSFSDLAVPISVVAATLVTATLVFRFATKNADQIGEAKFRPR